MAYIYNLSDFLNHKVNSDRLIKEIQESSITIALDQLNTDPAQAAIKFKTDLSSGEKTILDTIIANHSGESLPTSIQIVKAEILTEAVHWVESGNTTQALFAAESLVLDVSAGDIEVGKNFSWPYNIAVKSATIYVTPDMVNDEIMVHEAPNTLIGALMQTLAIGDTSIYVSPTVLENIRVGYYIGLYQPGETGIEIAQVLGVDLKEGSLTIKPSTVNAAAGSYLAMCSKLIPSLLMTTAEKVEIGKTIPTASRLPANIPIRIIYKNINGKAKRVSFFVEYIY